MAETLRKKVTDVGSFKNKIFILLVLMSSIPLVLVIFLITLNRINTSIDNAKSDALLRDQVVEEHITELFEKNLYVLRTLAADPSVQEYIIKHDNLEDEDIMRMIKAANDIFSDGNNIIITDTNADQMMRSDTFPRVNVKERDYFDIAMSGQEAVSDVLVSLATSRFIVVIEVPVFDGEGNVIGMVQRDYDLAAMQEFVERQATPTTSVWVVDGDGLLLADSNQKVETEEDRLDESERSFVEDALAHNAGVGRYDVDGEEVLISYSYNALADWAVMIEQPYDDIRSEIVRQAYMAMVIGVAVIVVIMVFAFFFSETIARPILAISKAVSNDDGDEEHVIDEIAKSRNDELGAVAEALTTMRSDRDSYKLNAETDKLTGLLNKSTTETICRHRIAEIGETEGVAAFFIVDLDHFKEVNDTKGHQYGDEVLKTFAGSLKKAFRPTDCLGRFGGDEFVIYIDGLPSEDIAIRKAKTINDFTRELAIDGENVGVTASIGIAIVPKDGDEYARLFTVADNRLYRVKEGGRDGYCMS